METLRIQLRKSKKLKQSSTTVRTLFQRFKHQKSNCVRQRLLDQPWRHAF